MSEVLGEALLITGFVAAMMLVVEYLNVWTRGAIGESLKQSRWRQYLVASLLGAAPGCLGAFTVVTLYAHRVITLGPLVGAMLATAGDESFVMFAMVPKQAVQIHAILLLLGIGVGLAVDRVAGPRLTPVAGSCPALPLHPGSEGDAWTSPWVTFRQWRSCSVPRAVLGVAMAAFVAAVAAGWVGPGEWNWVRVVALLGASAGLFVVLTASEHFLREHLWAHVAKQHVPRIFLWVLGTLLVLEVAVARLNLDQLSGGGVWAMLALACLVGVIPESGPHLVFVTLFARGLAPFGVLLASSIVQDGHGMLPLLAHSRRTFFVVKGINLVVGFLVGTLLLLLGR